MTVYETDQELRNQTSEEYKYFVVYNESNIRLFSDKRQAEVFDKIMNEGE